MNKAIRDYYPKHPKTKLLLLGGYNPAKLVRHPVGLRHKEA